MLLSYRNATATETETIPAAASSAVTNLSAAAPTSKAADTRVSIPPVANDHSMVACGEKGFRQPLERLNLHVATLSPIPKTYRGALKDPHWHGAMLDEVIALHANHTWDLVLCPPDANVVSGRWIFRHKHKSDDSLKRYKVRGVLRGFSQQPGIDYAETFSLVVKPATIRTVLTLAFSKH